MDRNSFMSGVREFFYEDASIFNVETGHTIYICHTAMYFDVVVSFHIVNDHIVVLSIGIG